MADSICDPCRAIDFEKALKVPAAELRSPHKTTGQDSGIPLDEDANRFAQLPDTVCPVCKLLTSTLCSCEHEWSDPEVAEDASKQPYQLQALSFLRNCPWTPKDISDAQDSHILLAIRGMSSSNGDYSRFATGGKDGYVVCLPKKREAGLFAPGNISETFEPARAKLWLQNCKRSHGKGCNDDPEPIQGLEVIDCDTLMVIKADRGIPWVALSYVWERDQTQAGSDDTERRSLPRDLPQPVQHAIEVTKSLGFKHLWVERYCINQQDDAQKRYLIAKMDAIFRGADLTIIAAAGKDEHFGFPGVGTTSRKKQEMVELGYCTLLSTGPDPILETSQSRWWGEGWTFQEGLFSRRRLIFTEYQSWFECNQGSWMEALGGLELLENPSESQWTSKENIGRSLNSWLLTYYQKSRSRGHPDDYLTARRLHQFALLVSAYTRRSLPSDTDALNAFASVSRHLRDTEPRLSHVFGIPYMLSLDVPDARERVEKYMFYFLSWCHKPSTSPRRRLCFPSWTWAGWAGGVGWMTGRLGGVRCLKQKMRGIGFEVDGRSIPQYEYFAVFDSLNSPSEASNITLRFEARVVPASLFSWNTYVETRDPDSDDEGEKQELKESTPPDRNDWSTWTVGGHKLWDRSLPPQCGPLALIKHLEEGDWGCLLLGDYDGDAGYPNRRFLLVVEWLDNGLAHRSSSVVLNKDHYLDAMSKFFHDAELVWKSVRLV